MNVVRWEEPPAAGGSGRPNEWRHLADELISRPGEWALVEIVNNNHAAVNHARAIRWLTPVGSFDAVSRSCDDGYRVYARYVGEPS